MARFAPPGVNRATSFLKNIGPYGAHSGIHHISPKPMGKYDLNMEINCFRGFIKKIPQTKTVKWPELPHHPLCNFSQSLHHFSWACLDALIRHFFFIQRYIGHMHRVEASSNKHLYWTRPTSSVSQSAIAAILLPPWGKLPQWDLAACKSSLAWSNAFICRHWNALANTMVT